MLAGIPPGLQEVKIPPGMFKNGTDFQSAMRWVDCNLVRWTKGAMRPIGGWSSFYSSDAEDVLGTVFDSPSTEKCRGMFKWRSNSGATYVAVGTNSKLYVIDVEQGTVSDITPTSFTSLLDPSTDTGYGIGSYNTEEYSTERTNVSIATDYSQTWCFEAYGENLIATVIGPTQPIYEWAPGDVRAAALSNAPSNSRYVVTTEQRILMSIGSSNNIRLVEWSAAENNNLWAPAVDNLAGDVTLSGAGYLICAVKIGRDVLVIGENDVTLFTYIGAPFVFSPRAVALDTSIISANCAIYASNRVIWWGDNCFWEYSSGTVVKLDCPIIDYLTKDLDTVNQFKTTCHLITEHNEIWWHYQSVDSPTGEPDKYVIYNTAEDLWSFGSIDRTHGVSSGQLTAPIMIDSGGILYNHEIVGTVSDPDNTFCESGAFAFAQPGAVTDIHRIYPDFEYIFDDEGSAPFTLTIKGYDFPSSRSARIYGPYEVTGIRPVKAKGRLFKFRYESGNTPWKVGSLFIEARSRGQR